MSPLLHKTSRVFADLINRDFSVGEFNSILASPLRFLRLLDHLIRPRQHIRRNCHADLLRGLEIDYELELRRLFYWKFPSTRRDGTIRVTL
jgi:hypothetical protein